MSVAFLYPASRLLKRMFLMNSFYVVLTESDTASGEIPNHCLVHWDMIIRLYSVISFRRQTTAWKRTDGSAASQRPRHSFIMFILYLTVILSGKLTVSRFRSNNGHISPLAVTSSFRHWQKWLSCPVSHSDMDSNDFPVQCLIQTFAEVTFLSIVSFRHEQQWLSSPVSHFDIRDNETPASLSDLAYQFAQSAFSTVQIYILPWSMRCLFTNGGNAVGQFVEALIQAGRSRVRFLVR